MHHDHVHDQPSGPEPSWQPPSIEEIARAAGQQRLTGTGSRDARHRELMLDATIEIGRSLHQLANALAPAYGPVPDEVMTSVESLQRICNQLEVATYTTIKGAGSDPAEINPRTVHRVAVMSEDLHDQLQAVVEGLAIWIGDQHE